MQKITVGQIKDTAILCALLLGVAFRLNGNFDLLAGAGIVLLVTLVKPVIFKPLAQIWFGFSHLLGNVMSTLVLSVLYFLIVTPVGLLRRLGGADPLRKKEWKKDTASAFAEREIHTYKAEDLERPF